MQPHRLDEPPAPQGPLHGIGVLVTRPVHQAGAFARRLATLGATPVVFPAIVILPVADRRALDGAIARLAGYDLAIFVSANAVLHAFGPSTTWPTSLVALAPGPGTAEALLAAGVREVRLPDTTFDSEGMLALPELRDVRDRRIVLFRGEGGRDLLVDTLRAQGAKVDDVACYRRARPSSGADGLVEALRESRVDAITVTSSEGLDNLWALLGEHGRSLFRQRTVFAPHPRIASHARSLGLHVEETPGGDAGLIAGLLDWAAKRGRPENRV